MLRIGFAAFLSWLLLAGAGAPEVNGLTGVWRGTATLNGDATPILLEFAPCAEGTCGSMSLPELGYAQLPLGPVTRNETGAISAANLTLSAEGERFSGALSAHGRVQIDALGHGGGDAQVRLERTSALRREFREQEVRFQNGDLTLAGTVVFPRGRGPHPAIVAVLGSGPAPRWHSLARAREWARLGYAALVYDKRGTGASAGDWLASSLDDLADDAGAGVRYLQSRRDIEANRVGIWAHSQGGWVGLRAITRGAPAAFLIAAAGGGVRPIEIERHDYAQTLNHLGVEGAERMRADELIDRYFAYLRGDIDHTAIRAALERNREAPWYRPLGLSRVVPTEDTRENWRWVSTYNPAEDIAALRVPVFVALAGDDRPPLLPIAVSAWSRALAAETRSVIAVFPGADHHMRVENGQRWRRVSPQYQAQLEHFLHARQLQ